MGEITCIKESTFSYFDLSSLVENCNYTMNQGFSQLIVYIFARQWNANKFFDFSCRGGY